MENKVKPITPDEILDAKEASIPDEMFEAINELIVKNWNGSESRFRQNDIIELFLSKIGENNIQANREKIFDNHWLDFEDIYRKLGWKIYYDKPAYNEDYPATFEFSKKK